MAQGLKPLMCLEGERGGAPENDRIHAAKQSKPAPKIPIPGGGLEAHLGRFDDGGLEAHMGTWARGGWDS